MISPTRKLTIPIGYLQIPRFRGQSTQKFVPSTPQLRTHYSQSLIFYLEKKGFKKKFKCCYIKVLFSNCCVAAASRFNLESVKLCFFSKRGKKVRSIWDLDFLKFRFFNFLGHLLPNLYFEVELFFGGKRERCYYWYIFYIF